ncbi:MAG: glycosyltransferase [Baekduia sp.]
MHQVPVASLDPQRFAEVLDDGPLDRFQELIANGREQLEGRVVWNVNSTATGGGVAEMLMPLIGYCRGAGVDARWVVIEGDDEFFALTKRIHNRLHGAIGDGGGLGPAEHAIYERTTGKSAAKLLALVAPDDIVVLHDPQTAGLVTPLKAAGIHVVWRCHVGLDEPNEHAHEAWEFLHRYVAPADAYIFSREVFVWADLDRDKIAIIAPSIDAFSPKNDRLDPQAQAAILAVTGISGEDGHQDAVYTRHDGTPGRVDRLAQITGGGKVPEGVPLVTQVSRWDRLKDPIGVMRGFAEHVVSETDAHLLLVGPDVEAVTDDPEGLEVLRECQAGWERLPEEVRERIHLITLPMDDPEENAAIVNAIQRASAVIVQKSLAEGFGLTVTEGMWKARPVVASRIGGIQDQIVDGVSGILVDPYDLPGFGAEVTRLVNDPDRAREIGEAAYERVREHFLGSRHLAQYLDLFRRLGATG